MDYKTLLAESQLVPPGFEAIGPADHPRRKETGMLVRNRATGIYAMLIGGAMLSVPPRWAEEAAAEMGKSADALQDACIARMEAMGLNPNQVAERVGQAIHRSHVYDYLARRKSMGSHKLQHLLRALELWPAPAR